MKKEIAEKWIAALRSDKYEQGQQALNDKDRFCCLGVLCDISNQGNWRKDGTYIPHNKTPGSDVVLPLAVEKWAGVRSLVGSRSLGPSLSTLNDTGHITFSKLADIIEQEWEDL